MRGPGTISVQCHSLPLCFVVLRGLSLLATYVTSEGPMSHAQLEVPSPLLGFLEKRGTAEVWAPHSGEANAASEPTWDLGGLARVTRCLACQLVFIL
jgi:hypothetical protein